MQRPVEKELLATHILFLFDVVTSQYGTLQAIGKRTIEPQSEGDRGPNGEGHLAQKALCFFTRPHSLGVSE